MMGVLATSWLASIARSIDRSYSTDREEKEEIQLHIEANDTDLFI